MMCGITGTPGTGKSMVADELARRGHTVVHITDIVQPYVIGDDDKRDTQVIDVDRLVNEFEPVDGFVEGHFAHLLPCDRIVVLRCRPDELKFPVLPSDANFVMVDVSPYTSDEMVEKLARRGVIVRSCRSFSELPDHYIRVSIGEDWENELFIREINSL